MIIVGAGLAGLLAAHAWPSAEIVEAAPAPHPSHAAILRFRSDIVSKLVGIEFRKVRVHKGIFNGGMFVEPSIRLANQYSKKILGGFAGDRSVWNVAPVDRWIAPESLYAELVEFTRNRVSWGSRFDWERNLAEGFTTPPIINTAPLPVVLESLAVDQVPQFRRAPILVDRFRVPNADVFQTVYFPTPFHSVYRASITGDLLIIEHAGDKRFGDYWIDVAEAFSLEAVDAIDSTAQQFGKIAPIGESERKRFLFDLTHKYGIYSLGRFATWRNILLDDVVNDINVIKLMLRMNTAYDMRRAAT